MILKYLKKLFQSKEQRERDSKLERELAFLKKLSDEAKANDTYGSFPRQSTQKRLIKQYDFYEA